MTNTVRPGRQPRRGRLALFSLTTILCSGLAAPAFAQSVAFRNLDANGVDLTLGDFVMNFPEGSIGSGNSALSLVRQNNGNYPSQWDGYTFQLSTVGSTMKAVVGQLGHKVDVFTKPSGSGFTSNKQNGATLTLVGETYVYQTADGTKVVFDNLWGNDGIATNICFTGGVGTNCSLQASTITTPNGQTATLTYRFRTTNTNFFIWRLASVTNSSGYAIKFTYQNNSFGSGPPPAGWLNRTTAKFFNDAVSTTVPQGTLSYSYPATDTTDITDMAGNVWEVTSTSIKRPGESSPSFSIGAAGGGFAVTKDGVATGYVRTVSGSTGTMTVTDALGHATTIVSDLSIGRPTSVTNALGKTTAYGYDTYGRLTTVTQPEGNYTQYTLDSRGNATQTKIFDKTGSPSPALTYNAGYDTTCSNALTCNQPNSVTDPLGHQTDYTYDSSSGQVTSVKAPAPTTGAVRPETRYGYTLLNGIYQLTGVSTCQTGSAPTCVGTADEVKATVAYDSNGNATSVSKGAGDGSLTASTAATYTPMGDLLTIDGPLSGTADTTTYRYDAARRPVGAISPDPDGTGTLKRRAEKMTYDSAGRITITEAGTVTGTTDTDWAAFASAQQSTAAYDGNGRKTKDVVTASGTTYGVTQYSYDAVGRLECTALRMNSSTWGSLPSSACTLQTMGSAGPDRISKTTYDAAGEATKVQTAYGTSDQADEATGTYNSNGTLATLTDAQGNKTTYEYDGVDRLAKTRYPSTTAGAGTSSTSDYEQLVYDANGSVTSRLLRGYATDSSQHIDYSYDNIGRLTLKNLPGSEPDVAYSYDNLGRLTSAYTASNAVAIGYDALSRAVSQTTPLGTVAMGYDLAGRRTSTVWPDSFYVNYDRLVTGEVSAIRENGATSGVGVLATYAYDDLGRRTGITRGNGTSATYGFDNVSRLSSLAHDLASTGNDLTLGFSYNPAGQIAGTTRSNDGYAWGGAANRNDASSVNGLNQVTSVGAGSLGYDARGNLTSTGGNSYTYSSENLLLTGPSSATLVYDPLMRLYEATGTTNEFYAYDGQQRVGEYNSSGTLLRRYVFGPGDDEPLVWYEGSGTTDRRWLHADERGSVIAVTDASGASIGTNTYDEYGVPGAGNIGKFQYTGQAYLPTLGLYYYKARIYSSRLGRFMQTDPIGYGGGMNWYNYVGSDPVNWLDPMGMVKCADNTEEGEDGCSEHGGLKNPAGIGNDGDININGGGGGGGNSGAGIPGIGGHGGTGADGSGGGAQAVPQKQQPQALCPPGMASRGRDASGQLQCVTPTPPPPPPPPSKPSPYWKIGCSWLADGAGAVVGGIAGVAVTALAVETGPAAPFIGGGVGFVVGGGVNRTFSNSFCPK